MSASCRATGSVLRAKSRALVGKGFESLASLGFADVSEVEIANDLLERAMAEISSDLSHGGSAFKHVGTVAVTQGVRGNVDVFFGESGFGRSQGDGIPHGGAVHRVGAAMHGLAQ